MLSLPKMKSKRKAKKKTRNLNRNIVEETIQRTRSLDQSAAAVPSWQRNENLVIGDENENSKGR